jgi:hypothetical protein
VRRTIFCPCHPPGFVYRAERRDDINATSSFPDVRSLLLPGVAGARSKSPAVSIAASVAKIERRETLDMAARQGAYGISNCVPNLPTEGESRGSGRPTAPLPTRNRGLMSVKFQRSITINFCTNTYVTAIGRLGKLATIWRSARVGLVRARRTCLLRHRPSETLGVASRRGGICIDAPSRGIRMSPFERRDVHTHSPSALAQLVTNLPYERS